MRQGLRFGYVANVSTSEACAEIIRSRGTRLAGGMGYPDDEDDNELTSRWGGAACRRLPLTAVGNAVEVVADGPDVESDFGWIVCRLFGRFFSQDSKEAN